MSGLAAQAVCSLLDEPTVYSDGRENETVHSGEAPGLQARRQVLSVKSHSASGFSFLSRGL